MSAVSHCAVVRNPFSTAVANAKLPDGAVSLSSACRYSISTTVSSPTGFIDIILAGGLHTGVSVRTFVLDNSTPSSPKYIPTYINPQYGVSSRKVAYTNNVFSNDAASPNQYRIVSQGLRISLINNSQDNDGWFEAIRCSPSNSYSDWGVVANAAGAAVGIAPVLDRYDGAGGEKLGLLEDTVVNWAMNPSYIAGKARDLYKHNFVLHRQENNDFIEVPSNSTLPVDSASAGTGAVAPFKISNNISPWWVDNQMDSVLIRIRGNTAGLANGNMVLHLHMVQHVEECYDERSDLNRFMTSCPRGLPLLNATLSAMKRDIKPSIIRSPSMPVSSTSYSDYKKKRRTTKRRRR